MLHTVPRSIWELPVWYRALLPHERFDSEFTSFPQVEAGQLLREWRSGTPLRRDVCYRNWLEQHQLTEAMLAHLLSEPVEALQARYAEQPEWLRYLREAFEAEEGPSLYLEQLLALFPPAIFLKGIEPLLVRATRELETALQGRLSAHDCIQDLCIFSLFASLADELLLQVERVYVLEMNVMRLQGELRGETPEERFHDFIRQISQKERSTALLAEYPVLARQLVLKVQQWVTVAVELFTRFAADIQVLRERFHATGRLVELHALAGDVHHHGRSVVILLFDTGFQLVYKPRSMAIDQHFQELVSWLNERGATLPLRTLQVLDRGDYGWIEYVETAPCASADELNRFYERQGSYLALLTVLGATDLHSENTIAAGEHPVPVDLEALLYPRLQEETAEDEPLFPDLSILHVGLLPHRIGANEHSIGLDISGLGGQKGQKTPQPVATWEAPGTDQMHLKRTYIEVEVSKNRPSLLDGQPVDVLDYVEPLTRGFARMYRFLMNHREEMLQEQLLRFAHDRVRALLRDTSTYGKLRDESFHPDLLRDALDRERFLAQLWVEVEYAPALRDIVPIEYASVLRGDIPIFSTAVDGRALQADDVATIPDFFGGSALDAARDRISHLNEQELARHLWTIRAALATTLLGHEPDREQLFPQPLAPLPDPQRRCREAASALTGRLAELAFSQDTMASWLSISLQQEEVWELAPADIDLYDGLSGIALFLAYQGALTGQTEATNLARATVKTLRALLAQARRFPAGAGIGAFTGLGGPLYLFTHLGVLWDDPSFFDEADELVTLIASQVENEHQYDVISGLAGAILALLALDAVHPSPFAVQTARRCGERLLALARPQARGIGWSLRPEEPPLTGFSHGNAGIVYSLLKLVEQNYDPRFFSAVQEALAYERSLFLPELGNWRDLREIPPGMRDDDGIPPTMVAWCHGAAGIGLARLATLPALDDAQVRAEIETAVQTTLAMGFHFNHSLCHGALGNMETLLFASKRLGEEKCYKANQFAQTSILHSIEQLGFISGAPRGIETVGLMTGLAGMGYELLRLAYPEAVPSVLTLEPPSRSL